MGYWESVDFKPKSCKVCEIEFKPAHPGQGHCSDNCSRESQRASVRRWQARNKDARREYNREYHHGDKRRYENRRYKYRYGITYDDVIAMFEAQKGQCAVCAKAIRIKGVRGRDKAVVDHCHESNRVRGLLCTACNLMIGYAGDDPATLESAIQYLSPSKNSKAA